MKPSNPDWLPRVRQRRLERKLVWIMGSPRSGSTWLMHLLNVGERVAVIREPLVGVHLGAYAPDALGLPTESAAYRRLADFRPDADYFFAEQHASTWRPDLRRLLLNRLAAQLSARIERCIVNEPNGSDGADLIMRCLNRSTLIFLIRDGRDVVDSLIDAHQTGAWIDQGFGVGGLTESRRLAFVEDNCHRWVARVRATAKAYAAHPPERRLRIHYEDLRADTLGELKRAYTHLGWPVPADLPAYVESLAFEAMPADATGPGKFHRAAAPGLWRQNLSPEEQEACHAIMGETLAEYGYAIR